MSTTISERNGVNVDQICAKGGLTAFNVSWVTLDKGFAVQVVQFWDRHDAEAFATLLRRSFRVLSD